MIIRPNGHRQGVIEYLENGGMKGREHTRDELDQRIIIEGDIRTTEAIIKSIPEGRERYDHITTSYYEEAVSLEIIEAVSADLCAFLQEAFSKGEINLYAEAHMPRLASYQDKKGHPVYRKPHVHTVVPKVNLVTGKRASVLEMLNVRYGTKYSTYDILEAFQNHCNYKYGLSLPRSGEHGRTQMQSETDVIANRPYRLENPNFDEAKTKELKRKLLTLCDRMMAEKIETPEEFKAMLDTLGTVKPGSGRDFGKYLKVKLHGEEHYTRLDYPQFTHEFICLPTEEKQRRIAHTDREVLIRHETQQGEQTPEQIAALVAMWPQRSREIRYLDMGTRFYQETYRPSTEAQKIDSLALLEKEHFKALVQNYGYPFEEVKRRPFHTPDPRRNHHAKNSPHFDPLGAPPETLSCPERVRDEPVAGHENDSERLLLRDALHQAEADDAPGVRSRRPARGGVDDGTDPHTRARARLTAETNLRATTGNIGDFSEYPDLDVPAITEHLARRRTTNRFLSAASEVHPGRSTDNHRDGGLENGSDTARRRYQAIKNNLESATNNLEICLLYTSPSPRD